MMLPAPGWLAPIRFLLPPSTATPTPFGSGAAPLTVVPILFPWMRFPSPQGPAIRWNPRREHRRPRDGCGRGISPRSGFPLPEMHHQSDCCWRRTNRCHPRRRSRGYQNVRADEVPLDDVQVARVTTGTSDTPADNVNPVRNSTARNHVPGRNGRPRRSDCCCRR